MRKIIAIVVLGLALSGCANFKQYLQEDEQFVVGIVKKIGAGVKVAVAQVNQAVDMVCSNQQVVESAFQQVIYLAGSNPGPKTSMNLSAANAALTALDTYCAGPRTNNVQILLQGYRAAQAAKAAINAAQTTAQAQQ